MVDYMGGVPELGERRIVVVGVIDRRARGWDAS
jgi:hypothetical protein